MITWGNIRIEKSAQKGQEEVYSCVQCGHVLGPTTEDWKKYVLVNRAPLSKAQPLHLATHSGRFALREYYCPNCGTMFEVQMLATEEPHVETFKLL